MGYRNVDDQFDTHPKVQALRALGKRRCGAAVALWTLAGCEARREVARGKEPAVGLLYVRSAPVEASQRAASDLAAVGLWDRCDLPGGRMWLFHDEEDWNITGERMRSKREGNRERQRRKREREKKAKTGPGHAVTPVTVTSTQTRPDQTRPDQTRPPLAGGSASPPAQGVLEAVDSGRMPPKRKAQRKPREPSPTTETWNAYSDAYLRRYQERPIRNARVNGQLAQLITRIPAAEAPAVAAFYVDHNAPFYVRQGHPVGALLKDCESLRTQWATGRKITSGDAREAERHDEMRAQSDRIEAMLRAEGIEP